MRMKAVMLHAGCHALLTHQVVMLHAWLMHHICCTSSTAQVWQQFNMLTRNNYKTQRPATACTPFCKQIQGCGRSKSPLSPQHEIHQLEPLLPPPLHPASPRCPASHQAHHTHLTLPASSCSFPPFWWSHLLTVESGPKGWCGPGLGPGESPPAQPSSAASHPSCCLPPGLTPSPLGAQERSKTPKGLIRHQNGLNLT